MPWLTATAFSTGHHAGAERDDEDLEYGPHLVDFPALYLWDVFNSGVALSLLSMLLQSPIGPFFSSFLSL
jgi:hypothetical protein